MTWVSTIASVLLVLLAAIDWWAVGVMVYVHHRRPDVPAARDQGIRFTITAVAASAAAWLGIAYLTHVRISPFLTLGLLLAALLVPSAACCFFLVTYYRRR